MDMLFKRELKGVGAFKTVRVVPTYRLMDLARVGAMLGAMAMAMAMAVVVVVPSYARKAKKLFKKPKDCKGG